MTVEHIGTDMELSLGALPEYGIDLVTSVAVSPGINFAYNVEPSPSGYVISWMANAGGSCYVTVQGITITTTPTPFDTLLITAYAKDLMCSKMTLELDNDLSWELNDALLSDVSMSPTMVGGKKVFEVSITFKCSYITGGVNDPSISLTAEDLTDVCESPAV